MIFTGVDGWPCAFRETEQGRALMAALRRLTAMSDDEAEGRALLLVAAQDSGRDDEAPASLPASQAATDAELRKLHDLAGALADHIDTLRRPAVGALFGEGADVFTLAGRLRDLQDDARAAFTEAQGADARGRPRKYEAAAVKQAAAMAFERATGRHPTRTTSKEINEVVGAWPDFLTAVFKALGVDASVPSQVKGIKAPKKG